MRQPPASLPARQAADYHCLGVCSSNSFVGGANRRVWTRQNDAWRDWQAHWRDETTPLLPHMFALALAAQLDSLHCRHSRTLSCYLALSRIRRSEDHSNIIAYIRRRTDSLPHCVRRICCGFLFSGIFLFGFLASNTAWHAWQTQHSDLPSRLRGYSNALADGPVDWIIFLA